VKPLFPHLLCLLAARENESADSRRMKFGLKEAK
jgi:hypothetical protein